MKGHNGKQTVSNISNTINRNCDLDLESSLLVSVKRSNAMKRYPSDTSSIHRTIGNGSRLSRKRHDKRK